MPLDAVAAALLLLCGLSAADALAPSDVTVSCSNTNVTVSWTSSEQAQTRFRVRLLEEDSKLVYETETSDHHLDLSKVVWGSVENIMNYYYVTVTALNGGKELGSIKSESFSYNALKTVKLQCFLEFPPVTLSMEDSMQTVSFQNPLIYYELENVIGKNVLSVRYSIFKGNEPSEPQLLCFPHERVCENNNNNNNTSFREGGEQYVTLKGRLCNLDCLGEVQFKETESKSESESVPVTSTSNVLVITLLLMIGILLFVIVVVTVCICKEKVWTMSVEKVPKCLDDFPEETKLMCPNQQGGGQLDTVEVTRDQSVMSDWDCGGSPHLQAAGSQSAEEGYGDGQLLENSSQSSGSGASDGSEDTESVSISSEERCHLGYDSPHCLRDSGGC